MLNEKTIVRVYLMLILSQLFWSGVFVAGQLAVTQHSAFGTAFIRNVLTSIGFLLILMLKRKAKLPLPSLMAWNNLFWMGFWGVFLYNTLVYYGLEHTTAVSASLLIPTTQPIFTQILSRYFNREAWTAAQLIGTSLGIIGAFLIMSGSWAIDASLQALRGNLLILLASFTFSVYSIFGKRALKELEPLETVTYSNIVGSIIMCGSFYFFPTEKMGGDLFSLSFILPMVYLVLFASILPYLWWYTGIKKIGTNKTAVITFLMPPFSLIIAALVLHQKASLLQMAGAAISLVGVGIATEAINLPSLWSRRQSLLSKGSEME